MTADGIMGVNVETGTTAVECPLGKVPTGGGYQLVDLKDKGVSAFYENVASGSYPTSAGWEVEWIHGIPLLELKVRVFAVCVVAS